MAETTHFNLLPGLRFRRFFELLSMLLIDSSE